MRPWDYQPITGLRAGKLQVNADTGNQPNGSETRLRVWFWVGSAAVTIGVLLQLPMYIAARNQGFKLNGMPMDPQMIAGMFLMVIGLAIAAKALINRRPSSADTGPGEIRVQALDSTTIGPAHIRLIAVLTAAVAIDTLKPYTFTFILTGVAKEYDLASPAHHAAGHLPVALLPFFGILGTAIGSVLWGRLGDLIGRRASILLSSLIFIASSACAAMPAFWENIVMCFIMGIAVGGFLPVAYSLLVETIPPARRGQIVVLVAGIGTAAGFLLAAGSAHWLIPLANWRIMWLVGIPTGLILIILNRYIPESPRFLLATGRNVEAREVMRVFGAAVDRDGDQPTASEPTGTASTALGGSAFHLFFPPYMGITAVLTILGLAWGVVNFGFIVWVPTDLAHAGLHGAHISAILAEAALFSVPGAAVAAWLYRKSAKITFAVFSAASAAALGAFAMFAKVIISNTPALTGLLALLLVSMWGTISIIGPYGAEVYPTSWRASGSGIANGATKAGGVFALALAVTSVAPPGIAGAAMLGAIPMLLAAIGIIVIGVETTGQPVDTINPGNRLSILTHH